MAAATCTATSWWSALPRIARRRRADVRCGGAALEHPLGDRPQRQQGTDRVCWRRTPGWRRIRRDEVGDDLRPRQHLVLAGSLRALRCSSSTDSRFQRSSEFGRIRRPGRRAEPSLRLLRSGAIRQEVHVELRSGSAARLGRRPPTRRLPRRDTVSLSSSSGSVPTRTVGASLDHRARAGDVADPDVVALIIVVKRPVPDQRMARRRRDVRHRALICRFRRLEIFCARWKAMCGETSLDDVAQHSRHLVRRPVEPCFMGEFSPMRPSRIQRTAHSIVPYCRDEGRRGPTASGSKSAAIIAPPPERLISSHLMVAPLQSIRARLVDQAVTILAAAVAEPRVSRATATLCSVSALAPFGFFALRIGFLGRESAAEHLGPDVHALHSVTRRARTMPQLWLRNRAFRAVGAMPMERKGKVGGFPPPASRKVDAYRKINRNNTCRIRPGSASFPNA